MRKPPYLVFDTETTGLTRLAFVTRQNHTQWPRLLQLAWTLADDEGIGEIHSALVRPDGFSVPPDVSRIHGITTERATAHGEPLPAVLRRFAEDLGRASVAIAHNFRFDAGVLRAEALRQEPHRPFNWPKAHVCTVEAGRRYLIEVAERRNAGRPRLTDLYQTLFGFDFHPKHDAASDVRACAHVYFRLKSEGVIELPRTL